MIRTLATYSRGLAPFVQRLYNAILWINHYPVDSAVRFLNSYPLDSDLSVGQRYPLFAQMGSSFTFIRHK